MSDRKGRTFDWVPEAPVWCSVYCEIYRPVNRARLKEDILMQQGYYGLQQTPREVGNNRKRSAYFLYGKRKYNILHTRLRQQCSSLYIQYDLLCCNLVPDPSCECGNPCENAFLFILECLLYIQQRNYMFNKLSHIRYINLRYFYLGMNHNLLVQSKCLPSGATIH